MLQTAISDVFGLEFPILDAAEPRKRTATTVVRAFPHFFKDEELT
jgi:hypothetical protein